MRRRLAWSLPVLLAVAACGTQGPSTPAPTVEASAPVGPSAAPVDQPPIANPCQFGAVVFDIGPVQLCEKAVALAKQRLGDEHLPVTSITFKWVLCPGRAPCPTPPDDEAWIVFTFAGGGTAMVHVAPAGGVVGLEGPLAAGALEIPPVWLTAEVLTNLGR